MERAISIYSIICEKIVKVSSLEIAETSKLVENIQRAVNIGLMNELKTLTDKMDINIFEVIDAASTKPFGFTKYYPGPGVGGHCIPIDPFYLTYKAKEYNIDTKFIELAGEVNRSMPDFVIGKVTEALNRKKLSISQAKILCLGISYKKNVGDTRESPPVEIFDRLNKLGAKTDFSDPYFDVFPRTKKI
jgi:UDP-N-acetyl-D-mannosaminuronate dehydrogenase